MESGGDEQGKMKSRETGRGPALLEKGNTGRRDEADSWPVVNSGRGKGTDDRGIVEVGRG